MPISSHYMGETLPTDLHDCPVCAELKQTIESLSDERVALLSGLQDSAPGEAKYEILLQTADQVRLDAELLLRELDSHLRTHREATLAANHAQTQASTRLPV